MLTNVIVLAIAGLVTYLYVKEEKKDFQEMINNDRYCEKLSLLKTIDFWKGYMSRKSRICCLIAILVFQKDTVTMIISIVILLMLSYALAKWGILDGINWKSKTVQKIATELSVALAILWVVDHFIPMKAISKLVAIICTIIFVIAIIFLLINYINRKK